MPERGCMMAKEGQGKERASGSVQALPPLQCLLDLSKPQYPHRRQEAEYTVDVEGEDMLLLLPQPTAQRGGHWNSETALLWWIDSTEVLLGGETELYWP